MSEEPAITYDTLLTHVQYFGITFFDFVNHLRPLTLEDEIDRGTTMTVYKSQLGRRSWRHPMKVALRVPNQDITNDTDESEVISRMLATICQDIRIMKHLIKHLNIIDLFGITFRDLKPVLVVELAKASLSDYLSSRVVAGNRVGWVTKARFCYEIAEGIKALHTVNIILDDITAENILLFGDSEEENKLTCKLSDFGYSSAIASVADSKETGGTPNFLAPECTPMAPLEMKSYAGRSTRNNYSYGLFVWQVAMDGRIPYEDMNIEDIDEIKHSDRQLLELMNLLPDDTPGSFKEVIIGMTQYEPTERQDLANARNIMSVVCNINYNSYIKVEEINLKILPQNMGRINLKFFQSMPIPSPIKRRLFRTYEVATSKGDSEAAYLLSVCYGSGFGVNFDSTKMISWAIQAARDGNLEAVKNIVTSYTRDIDQLPENLNHLFPWILQIAEDGHKESQLFISTCYKKGICTEKDTLKQKEWKSKYTNNRSSSKIVFPEESPLHSAACQGNTKAIRFFIQQEGMDVNSRNSSGITPLYLATSYGYSSVINALVDEFEADVNVKAINGRTPVHIAADRGNNTILRTLVIKFGAVVNVRDNNGITPLYLASHNGRVNVLRFLAIECGADINIKDNYGWSPFHLAAEKGHVNVVKLFVDELGVDVNAKNNTGLTPLYSAAKNGHIEVVKFLGEIRADVNSKSNEGWTPLHITAFNGNTDVVKLLVVEFGAEVNVKENEGWTPLHLAAQGGHIDIVKLLVVGFGADVNAKTNTVGQTPFYSAARNGDVEIMKFLVEFGADVNCKINDGWTPLNLTADSGQIGTVKLLVELGADINTSSDRGWTPLHSAAHNGHTDIVKLFVADFGVNVDIKNCSGWTPLHLAAKNGQIDTVKLLVNELEADINTRDYINLTPLIYSGGEGCKEVALVLSEHPRANIYMKNEDGETLLHLAVKSRQEVVVKILIEQFHLDIYAKDSKGQTPLDLADDLPIHLDFYCDGCGKEPIIGEHYKCTVCGNFDFCKACYSSVGHFNSEHIFKIVELPSVKYLLSP